RERRSPDRRVPPPIPHASLYASYRAPISASGAAPVTHSISLSWQPSTSSVVGYYVYEGSQSGGPYTRMNSTPCPVTTFSATNVVSGDIYYFTTTAVDSTVVESAYSNQVTALVP
ncbi:MAG TPA: fibronectin type III domain-containing protein, partial [Candidatus Acidoferrum sp.]